MNDQTLHKKVKSYKYFDTDGVLLSPSQKKNVILGFKFCPRKMSF